MQQITSRKNSVIVRFRGLIRDKKERSEAREFVAEGAKLVREGYNSGLTLGDTALVTKVAAEKNAELVALLEENCTVMEITEDLSEYISDTKTPQGIFAIFGFIESEDASALDGGRIIVLDGLQDMGNIGTIIRTCDAFGIDTVLLSENCGDVYSPKLVRSTMGSLFRQRFMVCESLSDTLSTLKTNGFTIYGTLLDGTAKKLGSFEFSVKSAVVIGNEGNGISPEIQALCDEKVYIPISGAESLNAAVASAVVCWELSRGAFYKMKRCGKPQCR